MVIVIPPAISRALGLRFGEHVALYVEDERMILRRLTDEELMGPRSEKAAADLFAEAQK